MEQKPGEATGINLPLLFARGVLRVVVLSLSLILSTLAAALMVTLTLFLGGDAGWLREDDLVLAGSLGFAFATWWVILISAVYPLLIAYLLTELARAHSMLLHLVAGALVAIAVVFANGGMVAVVSAFDNAFSTSELWLSVLSAGFAGGFIHWLIAGHRAGNWIGPDRV